MKKIPVIMTFICLTAIIACSPTEEEDAVKDNPFFAEWDTPFGIPPFDKIETKHYMPAFEKAMEEQKNIIEEIINNEEAPDFKNTIVALEFSGTSLSDVILVFYNILNTETTEKMQKLAQDISPMLSKHSDEILMNADLFEKISHVYQNADDFELDHEDKRLLELTYRSFVRGGAKLDDEKKSRLKEINERLSVLTLQFGDNLLAETNSFELVIEDEKELSGLSSSLIETAADVAKERGHEGKWVFTLHNPSVKPFLSNADSREHRRTLQQAYVNRCNNNNEYDNKEIILEIVELRIERAQLLGYETHADYVLEENMAKTPENVYELIDEIWAATLPVMKNERDLYSQMQQEDGADWDFDAADWRYYAEKVRKRDFDLDEEELKPYFMLDNVKKGIFKVSEKLFEIEFLPLEDVPTYNPNADAYEVVDLEGNHVGVLFMDYHPRGSKRGGAWMSSFREQYIKDGEFVHPIVTINCNFTPPTSSKPSLLTWSETTTFFHEFGHALHGLLSNCKYPSISGTSVPRDFVEMPSQIMEHWAAEPEVLRMFAFHYETGEVIPDELIEKMQAAAHFNQGFRTGEFLATAFLDMHYHHQSEFDMSCPIEEEAYILSKIGLIPEIYARHRSTYFAHGFSGGYSAGYYSYIWSEVLDSDAFGAFKENGLFDRETADRLKKHIFANGHRDDPLTMFVNFRGREPIIDPLLKNRGLK